MLCVYDKHTAQNNFNGCGLGIIRPSVFKTTEVENGEYSVSIEYPITDEDNMWVHLSPYNIVKNSEGQLFFIDECGSSMSGGKKVWRAHGVHISYYLADKIVDKCTYTGIDCHDALQAIKQCTTLSWDSGHGKTTEYDFTFSSNMVYQNWHNIDYDAINPLYAILGAENSILNLYGGSIHRDNFRISFNNIKEGSRENAFQIIHGFNMLEITETQSINDCISGYLGTDNYGFGIRICRDTYDYMPHEVLRQIKFSYSGDSNARNDTYAYADEHDKMKVTYDVTFADLRDQEKYSDWAKLQTYNIGDSGKIYSERLGIDVTAKIVERTLNDITGKTERIVIGNALPHLWANDRFGIAKNDSSGRRLDAIEKLQLNKMFKWEDS